MKVFHLTLAKKLPKRDENGWKLTDIKWIAYVNRKLDEGLYSSTDGDLLINRMVDLDQLSSPSQTVPLKRFWQFLDLLLEFMKPELPPQIIVRATILLLVVYGFADASGSGFGNSILIHREVRYRIGTWGADEDQNSSN